MKRRYLFIIPAAVLAGALMAFPVYPTHLSLCELIADRVEEPDRWATPHRGAVLILRGTLIGGREGAYAFETECDGYRVVFAVETSRVTLATPSSRRVLSILSTGDWQRETRSTRATLLARVSSEVQSCFGPGLVVSALAVRADPGIQVSSKTEAHRPHSPSNAALQTLGTTEHPHPGEID